jgi:adhesin transport system outer membrane protein
MAEPMGEVVRRALAEHPRIRAAFAGADASGFTLDQAKSARFPQLALVAQPGPRHGADRVFDDLGDVGLRGSLLLYDGGRTREAIGREEGRSAAAVAALRLSSEELAARVAEVYVEWYRQDRLADLARDNVQAHEALRDRVREIAELDRGRASDLLQVGARLEQAKMVLASREGAALEARAILSDLAGFEVVGIESPADPQPSEPRSLAEAVAMLETHPAVVAADAEAEVAQRSARLASAWVRPRVDLLATVGSPVDPLGQRQYFDDVSVRLAATWVPVDGGAGRAGARAAERQGDQARAMAQAARRDLSARVAGLWTQLGTRRQRLRAHQAVVEQTLQVREAYWLQFTIGRRSIVDLLNAEGEFFQARFAAEEERIGLVQGQYRLLAAGARLTTWLGVAAPAEALP